MTRKGTAMEKTTLNQSGRSLLLAVKLLPRFLMIIGLSVFILNGNSFRNSLVFADHVGGDEVVLLTNDLLHHVQQLMKADAASKSKQVEIIKSIIAQRKAKLVDLLDKNPEAVFQQLLPPELVASFPPEIRELLEVHAETEGELTVIILNNFEEGLTKTVYTLDSNDAAHTKYYLHFSSETPGLTTGSIIKVNGQKIDNHLMVLSAGGTTSVQTVQVAPTTVSGTQNAAVIIANFQDKAVGCSPSSVDTLMFSGTNSINNYYQDTSFHQINFAGQVFGPYTIPYMSTGTCDYYSWASAADSAATAAGVSLNSYNRHVYVLPSNSCGYAGLGTIGGGPSRAWIMGYCGTPDVFGHELGHNLGMHHAATPTSEYADYSDIMGISGIGLRQINSAHKAEMGWVPSSRVVSVSLNGTYAIDALESNTTAPQALKIFKPDTNEYYFFGYRRPIGFDASFLQTQYINRTSVHRWSGVPGTKTYLLATLDDGISFNDTTNGIKVTQLAHNDTSVTLSVEMSVAQCTKANPLISVSPLSKSGSPGNSLNYSVSIQNKNSSTCPASNFQLSAALPTGWTGSMSPSTLSLSPGATGSATWTVTSPSSAVEGTYPVTAKTVNMDDAIYNSQINSSYIVFLDTTAPTVAITNPGNGANVSKTVNIAVSATDNVGVKLVEIYIDSHLVATDVTAPYGYSWKTVTGSAGAHTITAKAYDLSNNSAVSAPVSVNKRR